MSISSDSPQARPLLDSGLMEPHAGFLGSDWSRDMARKLAPRSSATTPQKVGIRGEESEALGLDRVSVNTACPALGLTE